MTDPTLTTLAAEVVAAYVAHNALAAGELPALIRSVHGAIAGLGQEETPAPPTPAVPAAESVTDSHIVSLIDGKPYKSMKRHITAHGYTPSSYRDAFGLPFDYPMAAPAYARGRSAMAKAVGLGLKAMREGA